MRESEKMNKSELMQEIKDRALLKAAKIIVAVLLIISTGYLYNYEVNVVGYYQDNPEAYETDSQKILSYLDQGRCASRSIIHNHTDFGYFKTRYLMHKLSVDGMIKLHNRKNICLSFLGEALTTPKQSR